MLVKLECTALLNIQVTACDTPRRDPYPVAMQDSLGCNRPAPLVHKPPESCAPLPQRAGFVLPDGWLECPQFGAHSCFHPLRIVPVKVRRSHSDKGTSRSTSLLHPRLWRTHLAKPVCALSNSAANCCRLAYERCDAGAAVQRAAVHSTLLALRFCASDTRHFFSKGCS